MTKLFKRLSAVALAAAMVTTMAVSASAAKTTITGTLAGYKTEGILAADEYAVDGFVLPNDWSAVTAYWGTGRIFVSLDAVDYYTGDLIGRKDRTETDAHLGIGVGLSDTQSHVSLFSAHEVLVGSDDSWGEYRQLINV